MTLAEWVEAARRDAVARGLPDLVPALDGLARATAMLRAADWNVDLSEPSSPSEPVPASRPEPHAD